MLWWVDASAVNLESRVASGVLGAYPAVLHCQEPTEEINACGPKAWVPQCTVMSSQRGFSQEVLLDSPLS